jgi:predicted RNase H-like nuclease
MICDASCRTSDAAVMIPVRSGMLIQAFKDRKLDRIGLLDGPRGCDQTARKLLGHPRGSSVFSPPCREAKRAGTYGDACRANHLRTGRKINRQAWGIATKLSEVDEEIAPNVQAWAFEVHPEVCFWAVFDRNSRKLYARKSPCSPLQSAI